MPPDRLQSYPPRSDEGNCHDACGRRSLVMSYQVPMRLIGLAVILSLALASVAAEAQHPSKMARMGYLEFGSAAPGTPLVEAFRQGLRELGWVEGQNIAIEVRYAEGKQDRLREFATDFVNLKVDLIFASTTP